MTIEEKKGKLMGIGSKMERIGQNLQAKLLKAKPIVILASSVRDIVSRITGLNPAAIYCADQKYYLIDFDTWKKIILYDLVDQKKYLSDRFDCDNFSDYFAARAAFVYGLNSCGKASGEIKFKTTKKHCGYHRWNVILTITDNKEYELWMYEAMNDEIDLLKVGYKAKGHSWEYYPTRMEFN